MRVCISILAGFSVLGVAVPAAAQKATRSVDDHICIFTGKCGGEAQTPAVDDSIEAPDTKGFKLTRKGAGAGGTASAAPTTRAPVVALPVRAGRVATKTPAVQQRRAPQRLASASIPASRKAVQNARADLRLSFLLNSAELTAQAKEEAKVFAEALRRPELASKRFRIEGHTDASGPRSHNVSLSERRAAAVADYLSGLGVPRSRFEVRGYGPDQPLNGRDPSSPDNRRVEALLL